MLVDGAFREGAVVPVSDRGFRYGMSVFETFAVNDGRVLFEQGHLTRLSRAMADAGFAPVSIPPLPSLPGKTGMLRLYATAGDGGPSAPADAPRVFALFDTATFPSPAEIAAGMRLTVSRAPLPSPLGGWKTGNYWPRVQAFNFAKSQGFDEAVTCNLQGAVVSAAMANLFIIQSDRVLTPALVEGARDGVLRAWVADRIPIEETQIVVEDLETASECFVTNSRIGVFPVAEIDGRKLPSRSAGEWLAALYREEILRQ